MPYIPPKVAAKVKEIVLYTKLKTYKPQKLIHFDSNTYCTRKHNSIKIPNSKWYWFSIESESAPRRTIT